MNKLFNYKPSYFLLFLIVGIILQHFFKIWNFKTYYFYYFFIVISVGLISLYVLQKKILFTIVSFLAFIFIGITSIFISDTSNHENYYKKLLKKENAVVIEITKTLKPTLYHQKYEASITQINNVKSCGKILLNITKDSTEYLFNTHQKLFIKPSFSEIISALNPYAFDYKKYLSKKEIHHQVYIDSKNYCLIEDSAFSLEKKLSTYRTMIQKKLTAQRFSKDELSIINALLLGQRQYISKELVDDYTKAGAIHILAISGLHIGILLLILTKLLYPLEKLKNGVFIKTVIIIITLWLFALFSGLSASVIRATTMFTFIAIGSVFQKNRVTEHSLITSMFLILLIKPMFLFDLGFQLSYLAVFSIVWIQPILYKIWSPKYKLIDKTWQLITVSLAAQIGILPISLYYFHQFPGLFLLSNLVIIPLLGIILLGGFIIIALALLNILPDFIIVIYSYCIRLINAFIKWISLQEEFLFTNISMSFLTMISFYGLIVFCFQFVIKKRPQQLILALLSFILVQVIYIYEKQLLQTKEEFIVFHKNKESLIGIKKGEEFSIFHNLDSATLIKDKIIDTYIVGNNIQKVLTHKSKFIYTYNNINILTIDSLGIYNIKGLQNPIIVLQNNPKINLTRLIAKLKPQQIIANGSNYKSYVNRWTETCKKQKTPFYDTRKNGAFIIN